MKDAKFNMNRPPLSEKEINEAKDFNQLLDKVKQEPEPKPKNSTWSYILGVGFIALVSGVFWFFTEKDTDLKEPKIGSNDFTWIAPPLEGVDIPNEVYKVTSENGGTIRTPYGSNLFIPPNAFADSSGKIVSGEVTLEFREFHDVPSIFAAGINMQYDSAGTAYHFESAGMFEMTASQDGKPLYTNPNAPIEVDLLSPQQGDYYNVYYLDPKDGWQFMRKDTTTTSSQVLEAPLMVEEATPSASLMTLKKEYEKAAKNYSKAIKKSGLIVPQGANKELYSIKLAFKNSEFPELKGYQNVLFEVTEDNEDFDPEMAKADWKEIELKKNLLGEYIMQLYGDKKVKLKVIPVFAAEDMEMAEETFETLFQAYDQANGNKLSEERSKKAIAYQAYMEAEENAYAELDAMSIINGNLDVIYEKTDLVFRHFTVANFGMWNSDCPQNLPKGKSMMPVFVDANSTEDTLTFDKLYLAEYDKNTLFTYYGSWGLKEISEKGKKRKEFTSSEVTFNPKSETVLWCITNKGMLAVITPEELDNLNSKEGSAVVPMKLYKDVKDVKEVKKALGWK